MPHRDFADATRQPEGRYVAITTIFDTLRFSRRLKTAGFTPEQAEGTAEALAEEATDQIVTKQFWQNALDKRELILTIRMGVVAAAVVAANHYWK